MVVVRKKNPILFSHTSTFAAFPFRLFFRSSSLRLSIWFFPSISSFFLHKNRFPISYDKFLDSIFGMFMRLHWAGCSWSHGVVASAGCIDETKVCHPCGCCSNARRKLSKSIMHTASMYRNLHNLHFNVPHRAPCNVEVEQCKTIFDNKLKSGCNNWCGIRVYSFKFSDAQFDRNICWRPIFVDTVFSHFHFQTMSPYAV